MHQSTNRGHEAVGADPAFKGLSSRTNEGESCHSGTKYAHKKQKRTNTVACDKVILTGSPE